MVSLFYALPKEKHSDCQKFNMTVQLLPGSSTCVLCLFVCLHELVLYLTAVTFHQTNRVQTILSVVFPEKTSEVEKIYNMRILLL